jgi:hypothetical protein
VQTGLVPSPRPDRPPHRDDAEAQESPVLPDRAAEDREEAWGDRRGDRDDEWYRRERPPHHE